MQLRSGRLFGPMTSAVAVSADARFLTVIEDIKNSYKKEYHIKFDDNDLLRHIQGYHEIYNVIDTYEAFCEFARALRDHGFPSVTGATTTELEFCLLLDTMQMNMAEPLLKFQDETHRENWDNFRRFLHYKLFANTENGERMRFAVAEVRFCHPRRRNKASFSNADLLEFFANDRGFRYIYACEGEGNIFIKFCRYLVANGYSSLRPDELNPSDVANLIFKARVHHIYFLRPFELSFKIRMQKAEHEFASLVSDPDFIERVQRFGRVNQRECYYAFCDYLINGGFKWLSSYAEMRLLESHFTAKRLIFPLFGDALLSARLEYLWKRAEEEKVSKISFMPYLRYSAEGDGGSDLFPELPFRNKSRLDNPIPSTTSSALVRRN